jgi:DNA-binding protein HU-beta
MAKKAATPSTVTLKHLAAAIADEQELSKKQAEAILNDLVGRIPRGQGTEGSRLTATRFI